MLKISCVLIIIVSTNLAFSQIPEIEWQNTIGGNSYDWLLSIDQTTDGGYILGGYTSSDLSGDKTDVSRGGYDLWIIKLEPTGEIEWQKTIGGGNSDQAFDIHQISDGSFVVIGYSESNIGGDKSENSQGSADYWVLKLDTLGNILWQNTIGGSETDIARAIVETADGGFLLGGGSMSDISGDKTTANFGFDDYWVLKLNSVGDIEWQQSYGGEQIDVLMSMEQTNDGGFILGGISQSGYSGNKTEACQGINDYWIIKIDDAGNILWQNTIGGNNDDKLHQIHCTSDGGYILAGDSQSDLSGDKTEWSMGLYDFWIVKVDSTGQIVWQNTIGGSEYDYLFDIKETTSGQFILTGHSNSAISGDKTSSNYGWFDYWVMKLNSLGDSIIWQLTFGGSAFEATYEVEQTADGGFIFCGSSESGISPVKEEICQGYYDYWIIKLSVDCPETQELCNGIDDDCDGNIDEEYTFINYYLDFDGDDYGNLLIDSLACGVVSGYVLDSTDCDDNNAEIFPGATEFENGFDDNCNQLIDEGFNSVGNTNNMQFGVFPNPNNGCFVIEFPEITNHSIIKITSLLGEKLVYLEVKNQHLTQIQLPMYFNGEAVITIINENWISSEIITIQH